MRNPLLCDDGFNNGIYKSYKIYKFYKIYKELGRFGAFATSVIIFGTSAKMP